VLAVAGVGFLELAGSQQFVIGRLLGAATSYFPFMGRQKVVGFSPFCLVLEG
jgi:hypothetical protein